MAIPDRAMWDKAHRRYRRASRTSMARGTAANSGSRIGITKKASSATSVSGEPGSAKSQSVKPTASSSRQIVVHAEIPVEGDLARLETSHSRPPLRVGRR